MNKFRNALSKCDKSTPLELVQHTLSPACYVIVLTKDASSKYSCTAAFCLPCPLFTTPRLNRGPYLRLKWNETYSFQESVKAIK